MKSELYLSCNYFGLERAASILNCSVDELIHLGSIGAIDLIILIPDLEPIPVDILDSTDELKEGNNWDECQLSWIGHLTKNDSFNNGEIWYHGYITGIFKINRLVINYIEAHGYYSGKIDLHPFHWKSSRLYPVIQISINKFEKLTATQIKITKETLLEIKQKMESNQPISKHSGRDTFIPPKKKGSNNRTTPTERFQDVIAVMSILLSKHIPRAKKGSGKPNASGIQELIKSELVGLGLDDSNLSNLQRDISDALKGPVIEKYVSKK